MSYVEIFGTLKEVSFKGTYLSTKGFYTYDVQKPLSPQQTQELINIIGKNGVIQASKKFTGNEFVLLGYIKTTDFTTLKTAIRALAAFLYSASDEQLIVSDESDIYWNCQYLKSEVIGEKDDYTLVNLTFTCNDPFAYAVTPDTDSHPIIYSDSYVIANAGHEKAYPVITITFNQAQSHIYISNDTIEDNRFDITKAFASGDVLEVDCKNGTIKLNGVYSPVGFGDGGLSLAEWITLSVGNNTIYVGSDDESLNITVDITFNKVYLY